MLSGSLVTKLRQVFGLQMKCRWKYHIYLNITCPKIKQCPQFSEGKTIEKDMCVC
jgi:hypothetical protein